ncbi:MAG: class I SAM-dependent RNA methyltransferase [Bdellovibrionales bacterium]|nr:class I SAM-dependent RNA methyltransferase [Bdellovibrionales bacterium]
MMLNSKFESNEFLATVRDISGKGLGVLDLPDGRVLFVPGVWPGDYGRFEPIKMHKNYGFGRLVELIEKSPQQTTPPCPHQGNEAGKCGGCPWMIASYDSQLFYKQKLVQSQLERAKVISPSTRILEIASCSQPYGYRNRIQVKSDGTSIGFVSSESKNFAPISDCLIMNKKMRSILASLISQLPNRQWIPKEGFLWSFLEFDDAMNPASIIPNQKIPFRQANDEQNDLMKSLTKTWASSLDPRLPLIELFCGSGNFTEIFSDLSFSHIFAGENGQEAIDQLAKKKLPGVSCDQMDLYRIKNWNSIRRWSQSPQYLFLDPPRGGFPQIDQFCSDFPTLQNMMYISCDLHAFAADAKKLASRGWNLQTVQPVDQFPHTPHIELVAQFHRKNSLS